MKAKKQNCPKCGKLRRMTSHHIYPRRVFGVVGNNEIHPICRECHNILESVIAKMEKKLLQQHRAMYRQILIEFFRYDKDT